MSELIIIAIIIGLILAFAFRKPAAPKSPQEELNDYRQAHGMPIPPVVEDSSHLKAQLAETQQNYTAALQQLGQLQSQLKLSQSANVQNGAMILELQGKLDKVIHQKKSSEVKTGTFVEILAPIAEQFCVDPKTMRFLGSPIDYVSFDYETDMITFVEVKSGESQLNDNQRKVKKMVEEGRVQFRVVRLNERGIKVK